MNALLRRKIMGYIVSQAIFSVSRVGVPDLLADGPRPLPELAAEAGVDMGALGRFLRVLAAEGVFAETTPDVFGLTPMGELLRTDVPGSLSHLAELMDGEAYQAWSGAVHSLGTGEPGFDQVYGMPYFSWLAENAEAAERFDRAQAGLVRLRLLPLLDRDWSGVRTVVDVGGGNGVLMATLLEKFPELTGVVFDLPHVLAGSEPVLEKAGVADRVRLHGGDFFTSVPAGGDVYVLSQILHDWNDEQATAILRRLREAMPSGGRLLILEQVLPETSEPDPATLLDLHMLVLLGGRERTEKDWRELLAGGGFSLSGLVRGPRSALLEALPG
ncbi:methyltransferase [Planotetraspora thailandica]|uniref:Methyltransferase n=2 Tax=Planotetraspora thailandica TaxID=487172 RepID=A0A8J3UVJ3_9ACTN|nr:methyltransferase [Planotetraspora thailandica]